MKNVHGISGGGGVEGVGRVPGSAWVLLGLLLLQLTLGSAVRHSNAGVAIPDWPLHYGHVVPPMNEKTLMIDAGVWNMEHGRVQPSTEILLPPLWKVQLHFAHRLGAYVVVVFAGWFVVHHWRRYRGRAIVTRHLVVLAVLLALQVALGVYTVYSGVHPTLATLHQTVGAAVLAKATMLAIRLKLVPAERAGPTGGLQGTGADVGADAGVEAAGAQDRAAGSAGAATT